MVKISKTKKVKKMINIKCPECAGKMGKEPITMTYEVNNSHIVIKNVPAKVCQKCGHELLDGHTARDVDLLVNRVCEDVERFVKSLALPLKKHNISLTV